MHVRDLKLVKSHQPNSSPFRNFLPLVLKIRHPNSQVANVFSLLAELSLSLSYNFSPSPSLILTSCLAPKNSMKLLQFIFVFLEE